MAEKTRIFFAGSKAAGQLGDPRPRVPATDTEATRWHIAVGGTSASMSSIEDFAAHVGNFLREAYEAGVKDAQAEVRERLGL